ncbi:MAG: hypothetical protein HYV14_17585 [Elusimicrobia bacterium]|nr:hypothetical protein [Elusimicrobiota bacterium]
MDALSPADREVVDRLFNAAWREGYAQDRGLRPNMSGEGSWATVRLADGRALVAGVASIGALDWVRTQPPYYVRPDAGAAPEPVTSVSQVVDLWDDGSSGFGRFRDEVMQSAANLGMILEASDARALSFAGGAEGLIALAHDGRAALEGVPPEAWLEGWILRGHPFHPGCKTRSGFDAADMARYSPELGLELDARFVAVRRSHLVERRAPGAKEDWPASWREGVARELGSRGLAAGGFGVLPAHPWQFENSLPRIFAREIEAGVVVPLEFRAPVRPLVSLRTLVPVGEPGACHLKVPLAIQATSAQRTVSAPSAENGPAFSTWIEAARADLLWSGLWELQSEERGLHYWDPGADPRDAAALEKARHLSFLCRRPPSPAGGRLVPAALLPERSPVDGKPVVRELLELYGAGIGWFFYDYAALTLRAILPLALREGIALEAHAQNCLVRFQAGAPVSLVLRDLGGLRVLPEWAGAAGRGLALHPGTLIKAESPRDLVSKIHHTWLHNHLAPLARALADCGNVPEQVLWAGARAAARCVFDEAARSAPPGRAEALREAFFAPLARVKALTRMRLAGKYFQYDFAEVSNPLHEA